MNQAPKIEQLSQAGNNLVRFSDAELNFARMCFLTCKRDLEMHYQSTANRQGTLPGTKQAIEQAIKNYAQLIKRIDEKQNP